MNDEKRKSVRMPTIKLFESFYGKPVEELTPEDLGPGGEIDWDEDAGAEILLPYREGEERFGYREDGEE